jgi:HrpA-like RNA helicase
MPVDVHAGKLLLFGAMLRCVRPVLTLAAALSARSPFLNPIDQRDAASAARRRFAADLQSDHLTLGKLVRTVLFGLINYPIVAAFDAFQIASRQGRSSERKV